MKQRLILIGIIFMASASSAVSYEPDYSLGDVVEMPVLNRAETTIIAKLQKQLLSITENLVYLDGRLRQMADANRNELNHATAQQEEHLDVLQISLRDALNDSARRTEQTLLEGCQSNALVLISLVVACLFTGFLAVFIGLLIWRNMSALSVRIGRSEVVQQLPAEQGVGASNGEPTVQPLEPAPEGVLSADGVNTSAACHDAISDMRITEQDFSEMFAINADLPQPCFDETMGIDEAAYLGQVSATLMSSQKEFMRQDFFQTRNQSIRNQLGKPQRYSSR